MDATALRWVLAIIGVIFIAGIYIYTQYQNNLRKRSAIRTFTKDELDVDFIDDELLREELSHINTMLDQGLDREELSEININPALDKPVENDPPAIDPVQDSSCFTLPAPAYEIDEEFLIAYVLKPIGEQWLAGKSLQEAFDKSGFERSKMKKTAGYFEYAAQTGAQLMLANMTLSGSLQEIEDEDFNAYGLLCYFDTRSCDDAAASYELMLKKIDELVRVLNLKVYDQNLQLLTLQHVTEIRQRLKSE